MYSLDAEHLTETSHVCLSHCISGWPSKVYKSAPSERLAAISPSAASHLHKSLAEPPAVRLLLLRGLRQQSSWPERIEEFVFSHSWLSWLLTLKLPNKAIWCNFSFISACNRRAKALWRDPDNQHLETGEKKKAGETANGKKAFPQTPEALPALPVVAVMQEN